MVGCHHRGQAAFPVARGYPDTFGKLDLDALADAGREGGWTILRGKQCTEFGIGASAAEVVRAIFYNENRVLSVSVLLDGKYGQHDVYASVPAIVGRDGIAEIIELHLTPEEQGEVQRILQDHERELSAVAHSLTSVN